MAGANIDGSRSLVKILSNIFISFIGAGILGLPFAFKESGILEGILVMSIVGTVSTKAMLLIIDCKYIIMESTCYQRLRTSPEEPVKEMEEDAEAPTSSPTYGDVGYAAMGHSGKVLVDISIIVSQIGFSCAYLIFIINNLGSYMPNVKDWQFMIFILPCVYALTLFRRLGSLGYFSLFAQVSNLLAFVVVLWFDFAHLMSAEVHTSPREFNLEGLPFFGAVAIYCYEGAGMILSLEGSVHESKRANFKKYFVSTMVIVTMMYILFGVCGYLSFGLHTNPIITLNLPRGSSLDFALIVKLCLCLALALTYPVMMFPVTQILEALLGLKDRFWLGNLLRLALVIIGAIVVLNIPNFANLMALIGAGCCTLLAFILPGLFHLRLVGRSGGLPALTIDVFLISLGILGMIVGLYDALNRMEDDAQARHRNAFNVTAARLDPMIRRALNVWAKSGNTTVS